MTVRHQWSPRIHPKHVLRQLINHLDHYKAHHAQLIQSIIRMFQ